MSFPVMFERSKIMNIATNNNSSKITRCMTCKLCKDCGDLYEADRLHICHKINSFFAQICNNCDKWRTHLCTKNEGKWTLPVDTCDEWMKGI